MCWHDGATLAGHGYILMTFSELYIHAQPHIEKLYCSSILNSTLSCN